MLRTSLSLLLVGFSITSHSMAQQVVPVDDWKSAPTNQNGKEYPQVNSEGRVKFQVVAPEAKSVSRSFRDSSEFVKDDKGVWTGFTRPLDEGFHYYTIKIDDVEKTPGFKEKVKLVFVSYGSKEVGGDRPRRGGDPEATTKAIKEAGINSHYYLSPETAHEWQTWRRSLREFAPLLFQTKD
jgi:hypothetical protein